METQQQKPTSRFSTLNVFGKFSSSSKPPPPPPKDQWYLQAKANASCVSFSSNVSAVMMGVAASSSSHSSSTSRNVAIPPTTIGVSSPSRNLSAVSQFGVTASQSQYNLSLPRTISPTPSTSASSISMTLSSAASASTISLNTTNTQTSTAGSTFRRGLSKLGALGKRPFFGKVGLSKGARQWEIDQERVGNGTGSPRLGSEEDESISRPYDVHHDLHVDEELCGMPPEWTDSLRAKGYTDEEIMARHRRNRRTYLQNHPDLSPVSTSAWPPVPSLPTASSSSSASSPTSIYTKLSQPSSLSTRSNVPPPLKLTREDSAMQAGGRARARVENNEYTLSVASTIRMGQPPPRIDDSYDSDYVSLSEQDRASEVGSGSGGNNSRTGRSSDASGDVDTESYASVPPSTPPRTYGRTAFRVVNASPKSPPPAYVAGDPGMPPSVETDEHGYRRDVKVDPARQNSTTTTMTTTAARVGMRMGVVDGRGDARYAHANQDVDSSEVDRTPRAMRDFTRGHQSRPSVASVGSQTEPVSEESRDPESSSRIVVRPTRNDSLPPVVLVDSPPRDTRTVELPSLELTTSPLSISTSMSVTSVDVSAATERGRQGSMDSLSPDPLVTPIKRAPPRPPRLSLHQDFSNDLSSWSASLFSVLEGGVEDGEEVEVQTQTRTQTQKQSLEQEPTSASTASAAPSAFSLSNTTRLERSGSVSGLSIRSKSGKSPSIPSSPPKLTAMVEAQLQGPSTPLFDEVMSLVQQEASSPVDVSCLLAPASRPSSSYLASPSTPDSMITSASQASLSPPKTASSGGMSSGRDSQQTIGAASRWSDATIVRDAIVGRPAPATFVSATMPVLSGNGNSGVDGNAVVLRSQHLSALSTDSHRNSTISMSDFPLPPPSPIYSPYNTPPQSPGLATTQSNLQPNGPAPPPSSFNLHRSPRSSSLRSNGSSESESSTTSSPMKPLSVVDSDSSHEYARVKSPNSAYGVDAAGEATIAAGDMDGFGATNRGKEVLKVPTKEAVDREERACLEEIEGYGSVLDDWLLDSPTTVETQPVVQAGATVREEQVEEEGQQVQENAKTTVVEETSDAEPEEETSPVVPLEFELNGDLLPPRSRNSSTRIRKGIVSVTVSRIEQRQRRNTHKAAPSSSSSSLSSEHTHSRSNSATRPAPPKSIWTDCPQMVVDALEPLREFIDDSADPHSLFEDLQEIAEGESGSVYVAQVVKRSDQAARSRPPPVYQGDGGCGTAFVAIKNVHVKETGSTSPKIDDLRRELVLMSRVRHVNILSMDALYVDAPGRCLWIEMELMERSLADVLQLVAEGLALQEKVVARMASDVLHALAHLESLGIAHRDVRSDNLLINSQGVVKMADFSHALQYDNVSPIRRDMVGVVYWQAPEIRSGSYDVRKVDAWSVGATVWEMVESEPPFIEIEDPREIPDKWPALSQPELYSRSLHDFIRFCSSPPATRPNAKDLLMTSFIRSAAPRSLVVQLLTQCKDIEDRIHRRQSVDSQGTVQA